jgi:hypothetical protein
VVSPFAVLAFSRSARENNSDACIFPIAICNNGVMLLGRQGDMEMTKTEANYEVLFNELTAIANRTGLYLVDEGVDGENVTAEFGSDEYWTAMYAAACMAAGQRAEEAGQNINDLIGRVIY